MWPENFLLIASIGIVVAEIIAGGLDRTMSKGVTSLGYKIVYGEEDMMKINEVANEAEKRYGMNSKINVHQPAPPLPAKDVKCLMSSDSYCSADMYKMKRVLFQAMKNDCAKCSAKEKDNADKIVASLIAHDATAWKMFLKRYALLTLYKDTTPKPKEKPRIRAIGSPQEITNSVSRILAPGATVRVRRYSGEIY